MKIEININDRFVSVLKTVFARRNIFFAAIVLGLVSAVAYAVTIPNTFSAGQTLSAGQMNGNFNALKTAVDTLEGKTGNWDAAFGWGNHASAGYLTSFTETDPKVGTIATNAVPVWNGTSLVTGDIHNSGGTVGFGMAPNLSYRISVAGGAYVNGDVFTSGRLRGTTGNGVEIECRNTTNNLSFDWSGSTLSFWVDNTQVKTFVIDHPQDDDKYLVHGTLEGPEAGVYYRGTARLKNGAATVALPRYFEALTRKEGRTISLTNIDGFDRLAVKKVDGDKINTGSFRVVSDNRSSTQEFDWEVKAIRKDVPPLVTEPSAEDVVVRGDGPYTYAVRR